MVQLPVKVLAGILGRAAAAWPGVASGHLSGEPGAVVTVREIGGDGLPGSAPVVGKFRSRPDGPATPTAEDAAGLRPGWFLMLVSVRSGSPAEWSCWTSSGKSPDPVPMVVRLVGD
jgi:hypothetical protein